MAPFGLGAPRVDWYVEFENGRPELMAGYGIHGVVHVMPLADLSVNRLVARLEGVEEYAYMETDYDESFRSTSKTWSSKNLHAEEVVVMGPGLLAGGLRQTVAFNFGAPAQLPPSFESDILRVRWKAHFSLDVSGVDPSVDASIYVPLLGTSLAANDPAMLAQFGGNESGRSYATWVRPTPLVAGLPFSGVIDVAEQLDLGRSRAELRLDIVSTTDDGASGVLLATFGVLPSSRRHLTVQRVLWRGSLVPGQGGGIWRYSFAGQVPNEPIVTAVLPHGGAKASLDIVLSRPLFPDRHLSRPVAIASR